VELKARVARISEASAQQLHITDNFTLIKEKQSRPTVTEAEISALLNSMKARYAVLVALVAGTGLRIGEALAVRTEDFDPDCQVLHVRRSVWHRCEQAPKTPNAIRLVDIPEALAQVLRRYTEGKNGFLFTTRAGRLLDQRNSLKALHGAGNRGASTPFGAFALRYFAGQGCRRT